MIQDTIAIPTPVREIEGVTWNTLPLDLANWKDPVIFRGLVSSWPAVRAALESDESIINYLLKYYSGMIVNQFLGDATISGRYFYDETFKDFNFSLHKKQLTTFFDDLLKEKNKPVSQRQSMYVGSTTLSECLPGFMDENPLVISNASPLVSIWMGNQSRAACHYDAPDNIACCVAGKRRFTLLPIEQIENLYVGPLDHAPANQSVSIVDFVNPDFERFPKFRDALSAAFVAEINPGDALFIPSMWWHHVEGLNDLNILVNYWWRSVPRYVPPGITVLKHAMLALRDLPIKEKRAWKVLMDYYIFSEDEKKFDHIPEDARGCLGEMNERNARQILAWLLNRLNR